MRGPRSRTRSRNGIPVASSSRYQPRPVPCSCGDQSVHLPRRSGRLCRFHRRAVRVIWRLKRSQPRPADLRRTDRRRSCRRDVSRSSTRCPRVDPAAMSAAPPLSRCRQRHVAHSAADNNLGSISPPHRPGSTIREKPNSASRPPSRPGSAGSDGSARRRRRSHRAPGRPPPPVSASGSARRNLRRPRRRSHEASPRYPGGLPVAGRGSTPTGVRATPPRPRGERPPAVRPVREAPVCTRLTIGGEQRRNRSRRQRRER